MKKVRIVLEAPDFFKVIIGEMDMDCDVFTEQPIDENSQNLIDEATMEQKFYTNLYDLFSKYYYVKIEKIKEDE